MPSEVDLFLELQTVNVCYRSVTYHKQTFPLLLRLEKSFVCVLSYDMSQGRGTTFHIHTAAVHARIPLPPAFVNPTELCIHRVCNECSLNHQNCLQRQTARTGYRWTTHRPLAGRPHVSHATRLQPASRWTSNYRSISPSWFSRCFFLSWSFYISRWTSKPRS